MKKIILILLLINLQNLIYAQDLNYLDSIKYYLLNEDTESTLKLIDSVILKDSLNADLYFYQGVSYGISNRIYQSITSFSNAIRINPENAEYHYNLGKSYQDLNANFDAIHSFEKAIAIDSAHLAAGNRLARLYERRGKLDEALEIYMRHKQIDTINHIYDKNIARIYEELGLNAFAIKSYELSYSKQIRDADLIVRLSNAYYNFGTVKEDSLSPVFIKKAIDLLKEGEQVLPGNIEILKAEAIWYFNESYNEKCLEILTQIDEDYLDQGDFRIIGVAYYYINKFDLAIQYLEKYVSETQDNFQAYFFLGVAYRETRQFENSIGALEAGLNVLMPNWPVLTQFNLEMADTYLGMKNFEKAILEYDAALFYNPKNYAVVYQKAYAYDKFIKDEKMAMKVYNEFIEICNSLKVGQSSSLYGYKLYSMQRVNDITKELFFKDELPYEEELNEIYKENSEIKKRIEESKKNK